MWNNWLARDEWPDSMFNGSYLEMRIWNGALTSGQVANLYSTGPDTISGPGLVCSARGLQVTIAWPSNANGFTLQSASNISGPWDIATGARTVTNGLNALTCFTNGRQLYYRLKR